MKKIFFVLLWATLSFSASDVRLIKKYSPAELSAQANNAIKYFTSHKKSVDFQHLIQSLAGKIVDKIIQEDAVRFNVLSPEQKKKMVRFCEIGKEELNFFEMLINTNGALSQDQIACFESLPKELEQLMQDKVVREASEKIYSLYGSQYSILFNGLTDNEARLAFIIVSDIQGNLSSSFDIFLRAHSESSEILQYFEKIAFPRVSKLIKLRYWRMKSFFAKEKPFFVFKKICLSAIDSYISIFKQEAK